MLDRRDTRLVPTFQFMPKSDEIWTTAEAARCERDGDVITLIDMRDSDANMIPRYTVSIHDVVELHED